MYEYRLKENVEPPKKFIVEEADFQIAATEILHGLKKSTGRNRLKEIRTLLTEKRKQIG